MRNILLDVIRPVDSSAIPPSKDSQLLPNRISSARVEGSEGVTAGRGAATASVSYPVTCAARYYDAASRILEDELHLLTHDNADELGHVIQKWIEETRNNWEPR